MLEKRWQQGDVVPRKAARQGLVHAEGCTRRKDLRGVGREARRSQARRGPEWGLTGTTHLSTHWTSPTQLMVGPCSFISKRAPRLCRAFKRALRLRAWTEAGLVMGATGGPMGTAAWGAWRRSRAQCRRLRARWYIAVRMLAPMHQVHLSLRNAVTRQLAGVHTVPTARVPSAERNSSLETSLTS